MARYYALVASLPNLSLELSHLPYTQADFYQEIQAQLSAKDKKLFAWLSLEQVNKTFIAYYQNEVLISDENRVKEEEATAENLGFDPKEIDQIISAIKKGCPPPRTSLPRHIVNFLIDQHQPKEEEEEGASLSPSKLAVLSLEDQLAYHYYKEAQGQNNKFLSSWFRFNQNLRNVLSKSICQKLGWEAEQYIVGDGAVEQKLLSSKARDYDLEDDFPYIHSVESIASEQDISKRERMIDVLRWKWLEEQTEWTVFDVENVLTYYIRLGIIERWFRLKEDQGEIVFRSIVLGLKAESKNALDEFRRTKKGIGKIDDSSRAKA